MRSAGLVLLQTVPEGLGACDLRAAALRVSGVLAIHELHVWQLHRDRLVATAHVLYSSHEVCITIIYIEMKSFTLTFISKTYRKITINFF